MSARVYPFPKERIGTDRNASQERERGRSNDALDVARELARLDPSRLLRALERRAPGILDAVIGDLGEPGRFLDGTDHPGAGAGDHEQGDHEDALLLLEGRLVDGLRGCRDLDLVRFSATCPAGRDRDVAPRLHEHAQRVAALGERRGAIEVLDRREDGAEHAYGTAVIDRAERDRVIEHWCRITGASGACVDTRTVRGWSAFVRGDETALRPNMRRVLRYAFHAMADGSARDFATDVAASGCLADPWREFRALAGAPGRPAPWERLQLIRRAVPLVRACVACGGPLGGKRRDATTCSDKCRMSRRDRRRSRP